MWLIFLRQNCFYRTTNRFLILFMISEWFLFGFSAWNDCKCERVQCIEGKKNTLCSFVAYRNVQCLPFCSGSFFKINAMVIENGVSLIYVLKYVLPFQTSLHTTVVRPQLLYDNCMEFPNSMALELVSRPTSVSRTITKMATMGVQTQQEQTIMTISWWIVLPGSAISVFVSLLLL